MPRKFQVGLHWGVLYADDIVAIVDIKEEVIYLEEFGNERNAGEFV